jgi:hypothetical protein
VDTGAYRPGDEADVQLAATATAPLFFAILAAALGQPQTPAPQTAVGSKGPKNVVRTLHHQLPC